MTRRTPLYDEHRALGARIVEFGGWDMPLTYTRAFDEHRAVRSACGLFDVSHMGELRITGAAAGRAVARLTTNAVERLQDGAAQYSLMCNERGGIVDDLLVYRTGPEAYLLVVNAARRAVDAAWVAAHAADTASVKDESDSWALLALQGPRAVEVLEPHVGVVIKEQPRFSIRPATIEGAAVSLARSGYTGEDGFEVFVRPDDATRVWRALLAGAQRVGGGPVGLAARDTLRLEAGLLLYGSDMDDDTTPWEAGLGWVVQGRDFIGFEAVAAAKDRPRRRLVGFVMDDPGVPRHGQTVYRGDEAVGTVTSGTKSPSLDSFIGLAYVTGGPVTPGTAVGVEMRGQRLRAHVVPRPFYRRTAREGS